MTYKEILKRKDMMQLTVWIRETPEELIALEKECARINSDTSRQCYIIRTNHAISLWVNRMV